MNVDVKKMSTEQPTLKDERSTSNAQHPMSNIDGALLYLFLN
jgi:hypothetical protein